MALTYTYLCKGTSIPDASKLPSGGIYFNTSNKKIYLNDEDLLITYDGNNTNTKNTTGTTEKLDIKLFLAGATSQGANPQTYSNSKVYIGTDNCLYSDGKKVLTTHQSVTNNAAALDWNTTITVATIGSTDITVKLPTNPNSDTKVTSVTNHYTPSADDASALEADASGATNTASWNSTNFVTGVNLARDAKGHVTGITVDSIKMPANPNTDKTVEQMRSNTDKWRPLILSSHYNTYENLPTSTVTEKVYYRESIAANPSTGTIKAIDFAGSLNTTIYTNSSLKTIYQVGNTAGAKGYKIKSKDSSNTYTLESVENLEQKMNYVITASKNDAIGGTIESINTSTNQVTLSGTTVDRNGTADNTSTGDTYDYLTIIGHPELGTINTGYYATAFGNGTTVYAKNGFAAGKNCAVVGKHGTSFGDSCLSGHAALSAGTGSKAYGSSSVAIGQYCTAGEHATLAAGYYTSTNYYGQAAVGRYNALNSNNDIFMVGAGTSSNNKYNCFAAGFQYNNGSITGGHAYIKVGATYVRSDQLAKLNKLIEFSYRPYIFINIYACTMPDGSISRTLTYSTSPLEEYAEGIKFNTNALPIEPYAALTNYSEYSLIKIPVLTRSEVFNKVKTCENAQTLDGSCWINKSDSNYFIMGSLPSKYSTNQAFYEAQISTISMIEQYGELYSTNTIDVFDTSSYPDMHGRVDQILNYISMVKMTYKLKIADIDYRELNV